MRWVPCLVLTVCGLLTGCGLTLDLTPPEEDGGARADASRDAGMPDVTADVQLDAVRRDGGECRADDECFQPDCIIRGCEDGICVERGRITCAPLDACHEATGFCTRDGRCEEALIDEDGDGHAAIELGPCGDDCDDSNPEEFVGSVCALDLDGDGYGSLDEFTYACGDVDCEDGYVANRDDCWDSDREGILPGDPDPIIANPNAMGFYPWPRVDDGSFDWDCDGEITTSNGEDIFVSCGGTDEPPGRCRTQSGWESFAPACGEIAGWVACSPGSGGFCEASLFPERMQQCR